MLDLWRVGVPSIGETWPKRWNFSRSTGGLGTGVYAFRDEWAAKRNTSTQPHEKDIHHLRGALQKPLTLTSLDVTDNLNRLSRMVALVAREERRGNITWERALERGRFLNVSVTGGLGGSPRVGDGRPLSDSARPVLFDTPDLRERWGWDVDEFVEDFLRAAQEAQQTVEDIRSPNASQPLNHLLWPTFDGVAPLDGAGGNSGKWGCVVFKERIDACVGRETETFEQVSAGTLNTCWA